MTDVVTRYFGGSRGEDVLEPEPTLRPTFVAESADKYGRSGYDTLAGRRIAKMVGTELPWINLYDAEPAKWARDAARTLASWRVAGLGTTNRVPLILLGSRVVGAFGLPDDFEWLGWYRSSEHLHPMIAFPHPSGLNRWWNQAANAEAASRLLHALAAGKLPHSERRL